MFTKVYSLFTCHPDGVMPKSKENRRRLNDFVNSLFMDMSCVPSIYDMFSCNDITPYYSEDVTYTKVDLEQCTDALSVSTLLDLKILYRTGWNSFIEMWSKKYIVEARIWSSIRAQKLSRTINGIIYYKKVLRLLANLKQVNNDNRF